MPAVGAGTVDGRPLDKGDIRAPNAVRKRLLCIGARASVVANKDLLTVVGPDGSELYAEC